MNVHDSERMAGLLDQAGYEPTTDERRRRRHRHQHLQRARARRGEALHAARRAARARAGDRAASPSSPSPAAWRSRKGDALLKKTNGHVIDVIVGTQRLKMLPMLVEKAARVAVRRSRHQPAGRRDVPARHHAARRSGQGLRHDHRGLQRPLRVLRRAVHARPRAHAREGRHPRGRARGGRRRAAARSSCSGRSSTTTRRPTIRRATSRSCSRRSTTFPASSGSASPARIRATRARG